ncbi:MAG: diguanylate cyclase, domain protein 9 [Achromobacter mucicolens]|jgi:EAL domain-containing protein (putative c-di-GMP-specific phosphodiesterase class I)/GGDEF domain-containing protein|uniref:bifunctional diguanylate cyclase/phosphodiesterase n=1 Tax=Achromobacter TaxID=222 RepID=UPI0006FAE623|nr:MULTISPECIES: LapD/MoxY N-terminal periplasmic domain-containing protein [Achromobacter]KRB16858.1 diguanylate phosphodiesterase [Achromobacter sp. Root170]MDF2863598.1 diguanylate cyclase, domain protein 9 [Achromobacter mucicolens]TQJ93652.1 diguanylate cyclase/phosphodiesterase [Achromobacter sp. SLBN-14]
MSILRQLLLSVTLAISVILLGTLALSVNSAREYLSGQLQVQSTDAAVSLALSLSQPANNDPVVQELLVSALYDGGHFSLVRLTDPDGKVLIERRSTATAASVPAWFQALAPLDSQAASHAVSDGWRQIGEVTLIANDAYAWEALWRSSLKMIALVVGAGILWAIFAFVLVGWIKNRLLREISDHVRGIGRDAPGEQVEARVPELSGVVQALNQTRERIHASVEEQNAKIESLELELNQDPVTGLPNRKYFVNEFRRALETRAAGTSRVDGGHVLVFRQRDLADLNRHMPREFIDQWLRTACERIQGTLKRMHVAAPMLARLNGSDFALLLPGCAAPQAMMVAEQVRADLHASRIPVGEGHLCRWAQAMTDYGHGSQAGAVLARLDFGLMRAESAGNDQVVIAGATDTHSPSEAGERAWKDAIQTALEGRHFELSTEPLLALNGRVVRTEAMLMLRTAPDQEPIPATLFIPPAVRLDLVAECDLEAVRLGLEWLASHAGELAVRVSLPSLRGQKFLRQLALLLTENRPLARRLYVEIDAHGLVECHEQITAFARVAAEFGARIGVRRLAQQFGAVAQLHTLPLSYVKLGGGFVGGMSQSPGSQQLTASVLETARSLGIAVYAEDVPDAETQRILQGLGIDIMRGQGVKTASVE